MCVCVCVLRVSVCDECVVISVCVHVCGSESDVCVRE